MRDKSTFDAVTMKLIYKECTMIQCVNECKCRSVKRANESQNESYTALVSVCDQ
jgi:hypothetical protein